MAATESRMLALGTHAPSFTLPDVAAGALHRLEDFTGAKALLVVFLCAHCPYVLHVAPALASLAKDHAHSPLAIVGITS
ncbi:MAG: thioredoxin family protein, partial [Verrucomicrobia bacterium]|nr:thioredoxin family protein [Verrucomicrobiota bacterium]